MSKLRNRSKFRQFEHLPNYYPNLPWRCLPTGFTCFARFPFVSPGLSRVFSTLVGGLAGSMTKNVVGSFLRLTGCPNKQRLVVSQGR